MKNLADGILEQRDRLQAIKTAAGPLWNALEMAFYRSVWDDLIHRADEALGGRTEVTDMIPLYREMQEFKA